LTGLFKIYTGSNIDLRKRVCRKEVKQQCSETVILCFKEKGRGLMFPVGPTDVPSSVAREK